MCPRGGAAPTAAPTSATLAVIAFCLLPTAYYFWRQTAAPLTVVRSSLLLRRRSLRLCLLLPLLHPLLPLRLPLRAPCGAIGLQLLGLCLLVRRQKGVDLLVNLGSQHRHVGVRCRHCSRCRANQVF